MMRNMVRDTKIIRNLNAVAAGTSVQPGNAVDMTGYNAVCAIAAVGALTAGQVTSLKIQVGNAANLSDAVDLPLTDGTTCTTANALDADSNKLLVADAILPEGYRYVRGSVTRGTANAAIDGIILVLYGADSKPTTLDTTVSQAKSGVGKTP